MELKFIQIDQIWPDDIEVKQLRLFLRDQLGQYGEPLRWSITAMQQTADNQKSRILELEAVLIVGDQD